MNVTEITSANSEMSFEAYFRLQPFVNLNINLICNNLYLNFNIWYYTHVY
jgi:hypothetical protein